MPKSPKSVSSLADLKPDPQNARKHNPRNIGQVQASLQKYGAARSIVIDENNQIIAGHGVVEAAGLAGIERVQVVDGDGETIIAVRRSGLTKQQKQELGIADNRGAELAEWDADVLAALAGEIDLSQFWAKDELADLLKDVGGNDAADPGADVDKADELREKWQTEVGQLWAIGRHRLLVGDCTVAENVARLMGGEKAALLWTDPPYGVNKDGVTNDDPEGLPALLDGAFKQASDVMAPGAVYYVAHSDAFAYEFIAAVRKAGWVQARPPTIQWVKDTLVLGRGDYHSRSEPILYGWKPGAAHHAVADRSQDNVWEIARPKASEEHPTMKPPELVERSLRNSTYADAIVLDPFCGSGTTLVACEKLGRSGRGIELSPAYAAVTLERLTGMGLDAHKLD